MPARGQAPGDMPADESRAARHQDPHRHPFDAARLRAPVTPSLLSNEGAPQQRASRERGACDMAAPPTPFSSSIPARRLTSFDADERRGARQPYRRQVIGETKGVANARGEETEELLLVLS